MKKLLSLIGLSLALLLLSGCFILPVEAPVLPPPTITMPEQLEFVTVPVTRGDIILESFATTRYVSTRIERHYFTEDGIPILGIYVTVGDEVLEGDIIAALYIPEIQDELEELSRRRARILLDIGRENDRRATTYRIAADSGVPFNSAPFDVALRALREDLTLLDRLIAHVEDLNEGRYLRAVMDGVVTSATAFEEDMRSIFGRDIARISDFSTTAFVVQGTWAMGMYPGDRLEMALGDEMFLMEVVDPYEAGIYEEDQPDPGFTTAYLAFVGTHPGPGFEETGSIHIPLEEAIDVLIIPVSTLRQVQDRSFVYVLGEHNLRMIREVVPGIEGEGYIEIVSGLTEGELIIL
ncbi:MAG: hypothetical protein FWC96_04740 [Oscillospiraceae bacterium]|nr:hypothetical protein [Oscillospiraceae bacterium]